MKDMNHYRALETIIKKNSKTFYKAFSKLEDPKKRYAVYAVYQFCRVVDDYIDKDLDLKSLLKVKSDLQHYLMTGNTKNDIIVSVVDACSNYYPKDFDFKPFFDQIEGQIQDYNHQDYETLDALLHYCDLVASSVGAMLLPILTTNKNEELSQFSFYLGQAFQLTNILRDIGEDLKRHRVYIPLDILTKFHYSKEDLYKCVIDQRFINMFEYMAQVADDSYQKAMALIPYFDDNTSLVLMISLKLYQAILTEIRNYDYDVFTKKHFVSYDHKKKIIKSILKERKGNSK